MIEGEGYQSEPVTYYLKRASPRIPIVFPP